MSESRFTYRKLAELVRRAETEHGCLEAERDQARAELRAATYVIETDPLRKAAQAVYDEWYARQPGPGYYYPPGEEPTPDDEYWDSLMGELGMALAGWEDTPPEQQVFVVMLRFDGLPRPKYEAGYYYADTTEEAVDLALLALSDHERFALKEIRATRLGDIPDVVLPHRELPELRP